MPRKQARKLRKTLLTDLCSQPGEDDGIDPRFTARPQSTRRSQIDRKTLQLCGQVAHVVESILGSEIRDDDLAGLHVVSVIPLSHRGHLLVTVSPGTITPDTSAEAILSKLQKQARRIRAEVSAAITRRKTPELAFAFIPRPESSTEEMAHD